jgi:ribose/xylose/arabinose/galactoside ABC-type transport system permease subunit
MENRSIRLVDWVLWIPPISYLLFALLVIFSIFSREFLSVDNFVNIIRQGSVLLIVSLGMMMVIISGGIDLSVGSLLGLTGTIIAYLLTLGINLGFAVIISVVTCGMCGLISGLLIAKGKIFPFIVTFGMLFMVQGISLGITKGGSIHIDHKAFILFGSNLYLDAPAALWITLAVIVLVSVTLRQTVFGYYIYAIGTNVENARSLGVSVNFYIILSYLFSGILAGIAGIILASRVATGNALIGIGTEFEAIAAVVLGGTPITGGRGNIAGTVCGVLFIIILKNGLNLLGFAPEVVAVVTGGSIMLAVVVAQLLYRGGRND